MNRTANPITKRDDGSAYWDKEPGDSYLVTGEDCNGKRFRRVCPTFGAARCINVYKGNRWLVRGGKRFLIERLWQ
jgi:hypothetical protein